MYDSEQDTWLCTWSPYQKLASLERFFFFCGFEQFGLTKKKTILISEKKLLMFHLRNGVKCNYPLNGHISQFFFLLLQGRHFYGYAVPKRYDYVISTGLGDRRQVSLAFPGNKTGCKS